METSVFLGGATGFRERDRPPVRQHRRFCLCSIRAKIYGPFCLVTPSSIVGMLGNSIVCIRKVLPNRRIIGESAAKSPNPDACCFFRENTVDPASHLKRWILLPETPFDTASRAGAPSVPPSHQGQALVGAPLRSAALTWGGVWRLARTGKGRGRGAAADGRQDEQQRKAHGRQKRRTWGLLRRLQHGGRNRARAA